jgi:hypothetical protein
LPDNLFLIHHTETALPAVEDMSAFDDVMAPTQQQWLKDGGYHSMEALLSAPDVTDESVVMAANTGILTYQDSSRFW